MGNVYVVSKSKLLEIKNKYIFHGSPTLFSVCKPHKAKCESKNPLNEQNAIYGTNNLEFAILFAFEKLPIDKYDWCTVYDGNNYYAELHDDTFVDNDACGYIYCFEKEEFHSIKECGVQYVCDHELEPIKIYKIFYKDYKELFKNISLIKLNKQNL